MLSSPNNNVTWLLDNNNNTQNNNNNNNNQMLEIENEWYTNTNPNNNNENIIINNDFNPSNHFYSFPSKTNFFTENNLPFFPNNNNQEILDLGLNRANSGVLGGFNPHFNNGDLLFSANVNVNVNPSTHLGETASGFRGFEDGGLFLKPLDNSAPVGTQPTLFQKRAALRKNNGENDKKRKNCSSGGNGLDDFSFDGSSFNYDSDDFTENNCGGGGNGGGGGSSSNTIANSAAAAAAGGSGGGGGGGSNSRKKGMPAKNLMAERRRRKKLNDRLYMLRSVVPKISKMDRASILGDAIEYLKELLQKINDLHNELESSPPGSALPQTTSFHPLTPTLPNLPSRIKEELCPSSLPSPNGQPARIEVRLREGRAVNIHMFCGRRPGLLLSTMRALDSLGLDIQQAVISCFNGFAMDIFRAEQCKDGQDLHPEQIKAMLMDLANFHGSNIIGNCGM